MRRPSVGCTLLVACTLLAGCEQLLGIHDPVGGQADAARGSDSGPADAPLPMECGSVLPHWQAATQHTIPGGGGKSIAVGDVNSDSIPDVLVAVGSDTYVFIGTGGGNFADAATLLMSSPFPGAAPATNIALADVTGDGKTDVIASSFNMPEIVTYPQLAGGGFGSSTGGFAVGNEGIGYVIPAHLHGQATAADLVVFWGMPASLGNVGTYNNSGSGTFGSGQEIQSNVVAFTVADVDGNGNDDVVEIGKPAFTDLYVWWNGNPSAGFFTDNADVGAAAGGAAVGDLHAAGSALLDALAFGSATVGQGEAGELYKQLTAQSFTSAAVTTEVGSASFASFGQAIDLNGDGKQDVVMNNSYAIQCATAGTFYPMNNAQAPLLLPLTGFTPTTIGQPPVGVVKDLNGDGKPDLITLDSSGGFVEIALQ